MIRELGRFMLEHPKVSRLVLAVEAIVFCGAVYMQGYYTGVYDLAKNVPEQIKRNTDREAKRKSLRKLKLFLFLFLKGALRYGWQNYRN